MNTTEGKRMTDFASAHAQNLAQAHVQAATDTATAVAQAATYAGASAALVGSQLSLPDWAAIVSMTVACLGFVLQLYLALYRERRDAIKVRPPDNVDVDVDDDPQEALQ